MSQLIITVSGLRGIVGETLTPDVAGRYARAFSAELPAGPIVLSQDSRPSGRILRDAIRAHLNASGRETIDIGIAATPTVGVFLRTVRAAGAIQVSASHNPPPYNGMKLFGGDGAVLDAARGEQVKQRYDSDHAAWVPFDQLGGSRSVADPHECHLEKVLAQVDAAKIAARRFRVLLDSNHGAGSLLGRRLLEALGCDVTILGESPDGLFAHTPEPTAENLSSVGTHVRETGAVIGFCQDPDADRLALIDAAGNYLGEEMTLALCLQHVLKTRQGPIVINCATSRMAVDIARQHGQQCHLAAVGEANVVGVMRNEAAVFGGEGNGGPIDPEVGYVRDSFVGMALVLAAMAEQNQSIAELAAQIPQYAIVKQMTPWSGGSLEDSFTKLEHYFSAARPNRMDGLRLDWPDRWLLVRPSNTEPIIRLIAEAKTQVAAEELCAEAASVLGS